MGPLAGTGTATGARAGRMAICDKEDRRRVGRACEWNQKEDCGGGVEKRLSRAAGVDLSGWSDRWPPAQCTPFPQQLSS